MKKFFFTLIAIFCACTVFAQNSATTTTSQSHAGEQKMITLNTGYKMPAVGLGTWTLTDEVCEKTVYHALKNGYRLIDTAKYYGNEESVGNAVQKAIKDGIVKREEVFITTKIVPWSTSPDKDIEDSLKKLKVSYIDLCLLHQSGSNNDGVYRAMQKAVEEGKIRSIGISNFYTEKEVLHFINDFKIKPAVIQNENHIFHQNTKLRDFCKKYNIYIESYYPFGGRGHTSEHLQNATILQIAQKYNRPASQILVRWHIQAGFIAIPGSKNPLHIEENFAVWDFSLAEEDMKKITELNKNRRYESW